MKLLINKENIPCYEKASKTTFTDYLEEDKVNISLDSLITLIEDLWCQYERKCEELEDLEENIKDNYRRISNEELYSYVGDR